MGSYRPCANLTRFGRLLRIAASRYAKGAVIRASRGALVGYRHKANWRNLGRVMPPRSTRRDHEMYEATTERTELVSRESNGITVRLLWSRSTNLVTVTVADVANDEYFELVLDEHERALDVFDHPFAHAAARGLDFHTDRTRLVLLDAA